MMNIWNVEVVECEKIVIFVSKLEDGYGVE